MGSDSYKRTNKYWHGVYPYMVYLTPYTLEKDRGKI